MSLQYTRDKTGIQVVFFVLMLSRVKLFQKGKIEFLAFVVSFVSAKI